MIGNGVDDNQVLHTASLLGLRKAMSWVDSSKRFGSTPEETKYDVVESGETIWRAP